MIQILLIEDDPMIAEILQYYLSSEGKYSITWVQTGTDACALTGKKFDVILLDILLPDMDGISVCAQLRSHYRCPIIFISCLDNRDTIVHALEMGGDDFIVKPFDNTVLEARIQANLRRVAMDKEEAAFPSLLHGEIELDTATQILRYGGQDMQLSTIEFRLLALLMQNAGHHFTARELYWRIWGKDSYGDVRTVHVHIHNIRNKLEELGAPHTIQSLRGQGYSFPITRIEA